VPRVLNLTHPPRVLVRLGDPVELAYDDVAADTARIMAAIVDLLPPEARERREPTADELARTMPAGHHGDSAGSAEHEDGRRPGTD
jgi:putative phosphoserine phosphatase/1-acylglycerol-3-phosphate O-acyltransferase